MNSAHADDVWREIMKRVVDEINRDEAGIQIVNPERMREFLACGEALKQVFKGQGAKFKITPHDTYPSMGTIEITAKKLVIKDQELFIIASSLANNYDVEPRLNGTIVITFTFYELTKRG